MVFVAMQISRIQSFIISQHVQCIYKIVLHWTQYVVSARGRLIDCSLTAFSAKNGYIVPLKSKLQLKK